MPRLQTRLMYSIIPETLIKIDILAKPPKLAGHHGLPCIDDSHIHARAVLDTHIDPIHSLQNIKRSS